MSNLLKNRKTIQNKQLFFATWPAEPKWFTQDTNAYFSRTIDRGL